MTGPREVSRFFHFPGESNASVLPMDEPVLKMQEETPLTPQGSSNKTHAAVFTVNGMLPLVACTVLIPSDDPKVLPVVTKIPATHPLVRKIAVNFPNGQRDEIAFSPEVRPLHLSGKEARGRAFLIRNGPMSTTAVELGGPVAALPVSTSATP